MMRSYWPRSPVWLWCWRCGRDFQATRPDARHCSQRCRQRCSRELRSGWMPGLVYRFRFGPKAGRFSQVFEPDNYDRLTRMGVKV